MNKFNKQISSSKINNKYVQYFLNDCIKNNKNLIKKNSDKNNNNN